MAGQRGNIAVAEAQRLTIHHADTGKKYEYRVTLGNATLAAKLLAMVGRQKKVLEVGCASGSQTRAMAEDLQCSVVAIEIDPEAAERARPYCAGLVIGDVEDLPLSELLGRDQFDVILFADVLEHLRDPGAVLRKCRALLADDGFVLASLPNITHASITYELARGNFQYREKGLLDNTHLRFFSRSALLEMFASAGYVVDRLSRHVAEPRSTEFVTTPTGNRDHDFLRYVYDQNPEAKTYQFLVRAASADSAVRLKCAALSMREEIEYLERELHDKSRELGRLQSELDWLRRRPLLRFFASAKRLVHRR